MDKICIFTKLSKLICQKQELQNKDSSSGLSVTDCEQSVTDTGNCATCALSLVVSNPIFSFHKL